MTTVSASFSSAVGVSATLRAAKGEVITLSGSGTYAASFQLERATNASELAWEKVAGPFNTDDATVSDASYTTLTEDEHLRVRCTSYTSGTLVTSIADGVKIVHQLKDESGNILEYTDDNGKTVNGNLSVAGSFKSGVPVAAGSSLTLTEADHAGKVVLLDTLAGSTVTLPASTGKGSIYRFVIAAAATSNAHVIQVANATDVLDGSLNIQQDTDSDGTLKCWRADAGDDTMTFAGAATTGGIKGGYIEIVDYKAGFFSAHAWTQSGGGSEASPFSAAVS